MKRIQLQPAFVLHTRSYRETSVLAELFTPDYGRLTVVASGVRQAKSTTQGLIQPFVPLIISCSGKGELLRLTGVEANGSMVRLAGDCLFAGLYLNELLMYLMEKWDASSRLFRIYTEAVSKLQEGVIKESDLRLFEKSLLEEIGYGVFPSSTDAAKQAFVEDKQYRFVPEIGFVESHLPHSDLKFSGSDLLAMTEEQWDNEKVLLAAKKLMRFVLTPLLGNRSIYSRKLFLRTTHSKQESV